jgi:hypothetical protein
MPAVIPYIALAVTAATAVGGAVEANQTTQHAKGAAQAQQTADNNAIATANAQTTATQQQQSQTAQAGAAQKMAAALANMNQTGGDSGSITGASSAGPAPTQGKTLLGS